MVKPALRNVGVKTGKLARWAKLLTAQKPRGLGLSLNPNLGVHMKVKTESKLHRFL